MSAIVTSCRMLRCPVLSSRINSHALVTLPLVKIPHGLNPTRRFGIPIPGGPPPGVLLPHSHRPLLAAPREFDQVVEGHRLGWRLSIN